MQVNNCVDGIDLFVEATPEYYAELGVPNLDAYDCSQSDFDAADEQIDVERRKFYHAWHEAVDLSLGEARVYAEAMVSREVFDDWRAEELALEWEQRNEPVTIPCPTCGTAVQMPN